MNGIGSMTPVRFGWGGEKPLPKAERFQLKAPSRVTEKFTRTLAEKLADTGDDSPRFAVLTHMDEAATSVKKARRLPGRVLDRLSAFLGMERLQSVKDSDNKVVIKDITRWPEVLPVQNLYKLDGKNDFIGASFGPFVKRGDGYCYIADVRQYLKDNKLKEAELFDTTDHLGIRHFKPRHLRKILKDYTLVIDAKNAPGEVVGVLAKGNSGLYFAFSQASADNWHLTGERPYSYFTAVSHIFNRDDLAPTWNGHHDDKIELH